METVYDVYKVWPDGSEVLVSPGLDSDKMAQDFIAAAEANDKLYGQPDSKYITKPRQIGRLIG